MKEFDPYKNKESWGPGEWQTEPDRIEWRYKGFPLLMVRNTRVTGSWCGYVGVPSSHPFYKTNYNEIGNVDVHGGLTYSDKCRADICHEPKKGESDDIWWLGFDCSHCDDISPKMGATMEFLRKQMGQTMPSILGSYGKYRNVKYVKKECQRLADQLVVPKKKK